MDLGLTDEQRQLVASFAQLLSKSSSPERVRAAEPDGFDAALWRALVDTGVVVMGVPEASGGWGASLLDLALVAEQVGRAVAAAPVIEAQVAARLLAAAGTDPALDRLVTVAVRPSTARTARLTPAGAICDAAIVLEGDRLLLVTPGESDRRRVDNLGAAPLADLRLRDDAVELAAGLEATELFESALDEWLVLTAAAVVGIGAAALEAGCAYAIERRAFGSPIGAFQGVSHPLADDATHLDGARLLVQKAAWAMDTDAPRRRELVAMAFAFASRAAEAATYDALHVHGGYGFMLEYDVQLHYRRARGWPRVWGDAEEGYRRAARARYLAGADH